MRALAGLIVRKSVAWAIVLAVLFLAIVSPILAARLESDDNLLAFLPAQNPDVKTFFEVNRRFGGLDVALIGIKSDDPFAPDFLARLKSATKKLGETKGVDFVLSLTTVDDFAPDEKGGIRAGYLVSDIPATPEAAKALRDKVMSRDAVVGNLIAPDGKATMLYAFLAPGTDPKPAADGIRKVVDAAFPGEEKFWGGAPFIQSYIFSATEADLKRLTPWACLAIIIIAVASFRDAIGSMLALFSTGVGIVVSLAIMAALHVKTNLMLGSMPVILFALGSAYPIHLLTRYYTIADEMGCEGAIKHTLTYLGPTVWATGLVTISGLLSFMAMDMAPMRTFGLFTAIGVFVTLVLAVTFVPAVVRIIGLKGKRSIERPTGRLMVEFSRMAQGQRLAVGCALGVIAVVGAFAMTRLDSRIDNSAFYSPTSPPARAETFLRDSFGGSQFFQVAVDGDMTDPAVLREVRYLADRIALVPHVTSVNHAAVVVSKINEAMNGDDRIPDSAAGVKLLYGFLVGKKAVTQLVTEDRQHALLNVKVDTDRAGELEGLIAELQALCDKVVAKRFTVVPADGPRKADVEARLGSMVSARVSSAARLLRIGLDDAQATALSQRGAAGADPELAKAAIRGYLKSDEFTGDLPASPADAAEKIAGALASLPARAAREAYAAAIAKAIDKPEADAAVVDLASTLVKPVDEILGRQQALSGARQRLRSAAVTLPEGAKAQRFVAAIGNALMDYDAPTALLPDGAGAGTLSVQLTGQPVLNRGLSRSVQHNQIESFVVAMGLVFVIALVLYRSAFSALVALAPMALTLLVVYGGMGLMGVRLDIGTSMLASLSIGAGVDYAVHLLAAWKAPRGGSLRDAAEYSSLLVGRAIWTNAIMVAAGFVVLTMGEARPLQNVGGLTAAAMMAAAMATFTVIPVLARRLKYDDRPRIEGVQLPSKDGDAPREVRAT